VVVVVAGGVVAGVVVVVVVVVSLGGVVMPVPVVPVVPLVPEVVAGVVVSVAGGVTTVVSDFLQAPSTAAMTAALRMIFDAFEKAFIWLTPRCRLKKLDWQGAGGFVDRDDSRNKADAS
jgi:hypothetical protein